MNILVHDHAKHRMEERGTNEPEVFETVETGERFPVKFGRVGFRKNFRYDELWKGKRYSTKQVEVYAVEENGGWMVITVLTKYF